jgi:hypothetical protein
VEEKRTPSHLGIFLDVPKHLVQALNQNSTECQKRSLKPIDVEGQDPRLNNEILDMD